MLTRDNRESSVRGSRIHWLWRNEEDFFLNHNSVFISPAIHQRYEGDIYALHFDEGSVSRLNIFDREEEFDLTIRGAAPRAEDLVSQTAAIQQILEAEDIPQEAWIDTALTEGFRTSLESETVTEIYAIVLQNVSSDNDTVDNYDDKERQIRKNNRDLEPPNRSGGYSGPLFFYKLNTKTADQIILERKAPVNIVWQRRLGETGIGLAQRMKTNGWRGHYNYSRATRYAIVKGANTRIRTHGEEAARKTGAPPKQWHVRLVEIPHRMDSVYTVAGSVHHDPWDHGKLKKFLKDPDWQFSQARQQILDDWYEWGFETSSIDAGNDDDFDSSNGTIGVVEPL